MSSIPHPALTSTCPRCGAEPGHPCRTRGDRQTRWPHVQRQLFVDEDMRQRTLRRTLQQISRTRALCCECGNLRHVSESHRRHDENFAGDDNRHPQGWRCTQTLKCSVCKSPTRHAVLRDNDEPRYRDIAETRQHLETGAGIPPEPFFRYLMGDRTEYEEEG